MFIQPNTRHTKRHFAIGKSVQLKFQSFCRELSYKENLTLNARGLKFNDLILYDKNFRSDQKIRRLLSTRLSLKERRRLCLKYFRMQAYFDAEINEL